MKKELPNRLTIAFHRRYFYIRRFFFRLWQRISRNSRPTSELFINGDSFRALAHHVLDIVDETTQIPEIKKNEIVFVASPEIKKFFNSIHPNIQNHYTLITHNGDENIDESYIKFIDEKIIHWFAQNVLVGHPKLTPIPIGLENMSYYQNGIVWMYKKLILKKVKEKKAKILYHFKIATNPQERQVAFDYFKHNPLSETLENKLPQYLYLKNLKKYMFIVSPPGNGNDCIRTWEALYLGAIPIVKKSVCMEYFKSIGLPLLIVKDWNELDLYDEKKLGEKYNELMKNAQREPLAMKHWEGKIKAIHTV